MSAPDPEDVARSCKPFAKNRSGLVLGEGAAFLVLESAERAHARGARCYGYLSGYGVSNDAHHIGMPATEGQVRALRAALADASLQPADIAYVNAHATATDGGDVIESAASKTGKAHVIKSHHNVGGLPERMQLKLVEPLRELFKDEVRRIGVELGLPREMVYRHPFPGPGLGVRILGEVKAEYAELLQRADHIFIEELRRAGLYDQVSQAFAVFLPVRSVGVVGDARAYVWVIALRAVETVDFMTAHWAHLPYEFLDLVSRRIVNELRGVSRVVYDISGKPPATIEWE